ncbi:MFS transporter [Lichenihabitans sp. Uapishka_5]|uniref:MFS transporter n=1 Tax=Lichenihabitans sp. Uapishka_5 TaxID=3037302 RepID=UPI0029E7CCDB|nr:MFS transporter [Lichenihabitans sp. Uapishka_5]MDX7951480.1 MFS transporter [Lichenihabitans sp. Uapishka_5]
MTTTTNVSAHDPSRTSHRTSTRAAFFIAGFGMAAWAPLVPFARDRAHLDDASLGLLLLCLGVGSILAMPASGFLAARYGCRAVIVTASVLICGVLPLLASVSQPLPLAASLFLFGAAVGTVDVTVNVQAVIVEKASGRTLMSGFHGFFSLGGIAGAAMVSLALWSGLSPSAAALACVLVIMLLLLLGIPGLLPYGGEPGSNPFVLPRGPVWLLGALCFISSLAEGSMIDWSALFLRASRGVEPAQAGLGYAAFAVTMTLGRLNGDRIVRGLGNMTVLVASGLVAAAGFLVAVVVPFANVTLLGFALVGLGASNVVPILASASGRQSVMPANLAVSATLSMGYAGILAGPALIGFVAQLTSLPAAFIVVAAMLLLISVSARRVS